jgi:hypothetical protein
MTLRDIKKLETILAKVETLQNQTRDGQIKERLGSAKTELLRALRYIEGRQ